MIYVPGTLFSVNPDIESYRSFNDFFTRALRLDKRPIAQADYICPADGVISQRVTNRLAIAKREAIWKKQEERRAAAAIKVQQREQRSEEWRAAKQRARAEAAASKQSDQTKEITS